MVTSLILDKDGLSGLECWDCGKDAKYISSDSGFYCESCKIFKEKEKENGEE